ncbi:MAG: molybdenum cofactor guanylyltransferase [Planctomycetes bacterium]|nr:molybdenum cofactor guanylyltransferase [Planctomycetota bacterium]MCC7170590.1 molybdenum cofactor guanylyltransferase [Planctomycetota bacterium]
MPSIHPISGIVLLGGEGKRMGTRKSDLVLSGVPLAQRALDTLGAACSPLVVVHAKAQDVSRWSAHATCVADERERSGPLEALRVGLKSLEGRAESAFVLAVDAPFVTASFVRAFAERLGDADAVIPRTTDRAHPLIAVYRVRAHHVAQCILDSGTRAMSALLDALRVRFVEGEELAALDPTGHALFNVNTPDDLRRAEEIERGPTR